MQSVVPEDKLHGTYTDTKLEVPWSVKEEPHDPSAACHICQHCSASFILPSSLNVHLESYHEDVQPSQ
ncbi:hypothetical protein ACOMHN_017729 [Nucella lapillus]